MLYFKKIKGLQVTIKQFLLYGTLIITMSACANESIKELKGVNKQEGGMMKAIQVQQSYIVAFKKGVDVLSEIEKISASHAIEVTHTYTTSIHGFAANMSQETMHKLEALESVDYIESNGKVKAYK